MNVARCDCDDDKWWLVVIVVMMKVMVKTTIRLQHWWHVAVVGNASGGDVVCLQCSSER